MKKFIKLILAIFKFVLKTMIYTWCLLGATYFIGIIFFLMDSKGFDFSLFQNAGSEELKLMFSKMLQAFISLGIIFNIFEYGYKFLLRKTYIKKRN